VRQQRRDFATRLLLEGLVIMLSILAAFALDRWSEGRRAAAEERQVLEGLRAEFLQAREDLERYRDLQRRVLNSVQVVETALREARARGATYAVVPDTSLGLAYIAPTVQPSLGTLDGLLASARLGVLRDPELRNALAGWGGVLDDLVEEEVASHVYAMTQIDPVLRARVDVSPFRTLAVTGFDGTSTAADVVSTTRVPVDDEIIGVFAGRMMYLIHGIDEYVEVLEHMDRILARVESSLERS
jgi:type II secretory pathway pseudopilin PulG